MSERIPAPQRPWNAEEDRLLKQAVAIHSEFDNWKNVALCVPGRTNKACRKRWLHSLSPSVKKSAWTQAEDQRLLEQYNLLGPKWSAIARQIPGRTDDACSKRYREALDPCLRRDEWTAEEDAKLMGVYSRIGGKWREVGQEMQRSGLGCRNRWRLLERKKISPRLRGDASIAPSPAIFHTPLLSLPSPSEPEWGPPYYPPEAYPPFADNSPESHEHFHLPTPQELSPVSPQIDIPPFQFSSSSLSAALSDPSPSTHVLPSLLANETDGFQDQYRDLNPYSSGSPSLLQDHLDNEMAFYTARDPDHHIYSSYGEISSKSTENRATPYHYDGDTNGIIDNPGIYVTRTEHYNPINPPMTDDPQCSTWNSPYTPDLALDSSAHHDLPITNLVTPSPPDDAQSNSWNSPCTSDLELNANAQCALSSSDNHCDTYNSVSGDTSVVSTPLDVPSFDLPPSSTSSSATSAVDLPENQQPASGSLLFSSHYRSTRPRPTRRLKPRSAATRLSSLLPVTTDPSVLPYACGHNDCWPSDLEIGRTRFATSGELAEHNKTTHAAQPSERPFKCALDGCGKSWKNINGLQYHLQISTVHFRDALSTTFSMQTSTNPPVETLPADDPPDEADMLKRRFICKHPQCFKAYRQVGGLIYHLQFGHPEDLPAQLEVVPPTLARQLAKKTKKMRPKAAPAPAQLT